MPFAPNPLWNFVIRIATGVAAVYESYALYFDTDTISIFARRLADTHAQVYIFSGVILAALAAIEVYGTGLPVLTRFIVLFWIFVFGHIFWGFCL